MEPLQIAILILRILISIYGEDYKPKIDWFILSERSINEKIVFLGDFKGVKEIIICDNSLFDNCNFKNKQKIILLGQTQVLIELDTYPFQVPDKFYVHTLNKKGKPTHPIGYEIRMGFTIDRIHTLSSNFLKR